MNSTILDRIVAEKHLELGRLPRHEVTPDDLHRAIETHGPRRPFFAALRKRSAPRPGLIAEVKKASPSAGVIRPDFDPVRIALDYAAAGADAISVLTDRAFFQGSLEYLRAIREAVEVPLLRKDFIIDARQIVEAIEWGADAILLIVAILDDHRLRLFHELAEAAGLAALVEVHDEAELERAIALGAPLIGVNNRNLKTFTVDLATTERLAARLLEVRHPSETLLVAESGIHSRADVDRLLMGGANAILVGESLMREADIAAKVRELTGS